MIYDDRRQQFSGECKPVVPFNWPLAKYVKLRVVHAPGMPGTFSPPPRVSDPDMLHGTCVTHVPWCMPGSLTSGFLWSRWQGKRSRHFRRMRNPQFYVYGKRPMTVLLIRHWDAKWWLLTGLKKWLRSNKTPSGWYEVTVNRRAFTIILRVIVVDRYEQLDCRSLQSTPWTGTGHRRLSGWETIVFTATHAAKDVC